MTGLERLWRALTVLSIATVCAGEPDSITIELAEMNASGISGVAKLEPAGELKTRITVLEVHGGDITGARVMPEPCSNDLDDKFPITPPTGVVQVDFEQFRRWDDAGPLAVVFMRRGRYVACGES